MLATMTMQSQQGQSLRSFRIRVLTETYYHRSLNIVGNE